MAESASHGPDGSERRRFPRFDTKDLLIACLTTPDVPVRVRDIGIGGFSVETVDPLEAGVVQDIRFIAHDDWSATVRAQSIHSRPTVASDGTPRYSTGFAFLSASSAKQAVESLIERITQVKLFGSR